MNRIRAARKRKVNGIASLHGNSVKGDLQAGKKKCVTTNQSYHNGTNGEQVCAGQKRKMHTSKSISSPESRGSWVRIDVPASEFNLSATLTCGQAFRWLYHKDLGEWHGVINGNLWRLRQTTPLDSVYFFSHCYTPTNGPFEASATKTPADLVSYFRLDVNLAELLASWKVRDGAWFGAVDGDACAVRLLDQDPVETLFAFITSANNNVPRISQLLSKLCQTHGEPLRDRSCIRQWRFPTLEKLAGEDMVSELQSLGFGYRAKYIPAAARMILDNGGAGYLHSLRSETYDNVRRLLLKLPGIGPKVADCICLSALDKVNVVPVDVHIFRAANERGLVGLNKNGSKGLSSMCYLRVSTALSDLWGSYAGWAQLSEVEETFKRLTSHKGVIGAIIQSADGSAIRSSFDSSTTVHHCALWQQLIIKARSAVRDLDPSNDLMFLRVRSKVNEVMISFDKEYSLIVVHATAPE